MADGLFSSLVDKYQNSVDMQKRVYGESLLKSFTNSTKNPISNSNFTEKELGELDKLIKSHYQEKLNYFTRPKKELLKEAALLENNAKDGLASLKTIDPSQTDAVERLKNKAQLYLTQAKQLRDAAEGKIPSDFSFQYTGYGSRVGQNKFENDPMGWAQTLGRFRYKINPETGEYIVYDSYDFNNKVHKHAADSYAAMNPVSRLASSLTNTIINGDQYALGEAYLAGENAVPVQIKRSLNNQAQAPSNLTYQDPFGSTIK